MRRTGTVILAFALLIISDAYIDVVTPVLPDIRLFFAKSHIQGNLCVIFDMCGFAVASIFYGYYADTYGRKPTAIVGLSFFITGTLITCIGVSDADYFRIFLFGYFLQGVGQGCAEVIIMSVIRDLYTGIKLDKYITLIGVVTATVPALSPLLGGIFVKFFHWNNIFYSLGCILVCLLLLFIFCGKETLKKKSPSSVKSFVVGYFKLFCNTKCMLLLTLIILTFCWIWNTILNLPHVFIGNGVNASEYGICIILYMVVYILGSASNPFIIMKFGRKNVMLLSLIVIPANAVLLIFATSLFSLHPYVIEIFWWPEAFFLSLLINNLFASILKVVKEEDAAKLSGLLSFFKSFASIGSFFATYIGSFFFSHDDIRPILLWTLLCSLVSLVMFVCVSSKLFVGHNMEVKLAK